MLHLSDLCFILSFIFTVINHIAPLKQIHLPFVQFFKYLLLFWDDDIDEESE